MNVFYLFFFFFILSFLLLLWRPVYENAELKRVQKTACKNTKYELLIEEKIQGQENVFEKQQRETVPRTVLILEKEKLEYSPTLHGLII